MTDQELLQAAAKAAGIVVAYVDYEGETHQQFFDPLDESGCEMDWNPLTDDGDALRLAVKLGLAVITYGPYSEAYSMRSPEANRVEKHGDPYAATRRAIVRAAAATVKEEG